MKPSWTFFTSRHPISQLFISSLHSWLLRSHVYPHLPGGQWRSSGSGTTRTKGRIFLFLLEILRSILRKLEGALKRSTKFLVGTHLPESRLGLLKRPRWVFLFGSRAQEILTPAVLHQPSTTRIGPSSPFFQGEISPLFKERITEALGSSSPTTPTPPARIRRGKPRGLRDIRESSAGLSSSSTPTPPSSPTSRNTRITGEGKVFRLGSVLASLL